jgi:hypothetical protein
MGVPFSDVPKGKAPPLPRGDVFVAAIVEEAAARLYFFLRTRTQPS